MSKKKKRLNSKEKFVLYEIKPFNQSILLYYGKDTLGLVKELNKKKNKALSKWLDKRMNEGFTLEDEDTVNGFVKFDKNSYPRILYVKNRFNKQFTYQTLVHEISHMVDYLSKFYEFEDETEFKAYLSECLFKDFNNIIYGNS